MELKSFRVRNFRSINDSGEIDVSRITALLGRNESGKSNILRALHSLNPASGFTKLKPIKFPGTESCPNATTTRLSGSDMGVEPIRARTPLKSGQRQRR
jgi:recombinational DNA repair ATPase RecF